MAGKGKRLTLLTATVLVIVGAILVTEYWSELLAEYRFWRDFESLGTNEQGYREYRHRQTGIVFVSLPGGTFMMGSPEDEKGRGDNERQHQVTLSPFLIAKYEVSQAEWVRAMGSGSNRSNFKRQNLPVENVSWDDIQRFEEETDLVLPSEAQWEYASRAGTTSPFSLGETITPGQANYDKNRGKTVDVTSFKPNAFGIHNMHGNVWEWCEDYYDRDFYSSSSGRKENPLCTSSSEYRINRGGCWSGNASSCRSAARFWYRPANRALFLGFRPCVDRRAYLATAGD